MSLNSLLPIWEINSRLFSKVSNSVNYYNFLFSTYPGHYNFKEFGDMASCFGSFNLFVMQRLLSADVMLGVMESILRMLVNI